MWASGRGDESLVKSLLDHGAHVNIKTIVRTEGMSTAKSLFLIVLSKNAWIDIFVFYHANVYKVNVYEARPFNLSMG